MLTYSFTDIGPDSLYMHLYKCIKNDILDGKLEPGTKLPSKRAFAKNLGISSITVENAYGQLLAEGYIFSLQRKGFYVTELPRVMEKAQEEDTKKNIKCHALDENETLNGICDIDLVSNCMHHDNFPFSIWARLMREVITGKSSALMQKSPWGGIMELRSAISLHLKQFRNMEVAPEQIIIGAGTEYLYGLIIQLLGYDKVYAVENPGYKKIAQIYKANNVACKYIPIDSSGIIVDELKKRGADVAHISPSHHYPTGIVTPISRRYDILGWASSGSSRYIIEDDYDSEFRLAGRPMPALQSIDVMERVIYINTFTKSLAPTIRISYMILPKRLLELFYEKLGFYSCTVSNFEQYTLAEFIKGGYFEKHINRMRNYYRNIRNELMKRIKASPLADKCEISEEEAGLHFLLDIHTDMQDEEFIDICRENRINVSCLSQYYNEDKDDVDMRNSIKQHTLIMNYSGLKYDDIDTVIEILCRVIGV